MAKRKQKRKVSRKRQVIAETSPRRTINIPVRTIPIQWISERVDTDGDGVPDIHDCEPLNPHKQGRGFGVYRVEGKDSYGNPLYAIYRNKHMGASLVKFGKPLYIGPKTDCEEQMTQIPLDPEMYRA